MARDQRQARRRTEALGRTGRAVTRARGVWQPPQRRHLPWRAVQDLAHRPLAARGAGGKADRGRQARPEPHHLRLRPPHPPLQGLRVDRDAAVPLALQLLPQPRHRPDQRLDGRDLRTLGLGARGRDRDPGALVPESERAQADDRPAGLRRWGQPRPDEHARQESCARERDRGQGLALPPSTSPAVRMAWWCTATWPASKAHAAP